MWSQEAGGRRFLDGSLTAVCWDEGTRPRGRSGRFCGGAASCDPGRPGLTAGSSAHPPPPPPQRGPRARPTGRHSAKEASAGPSGPRARALPTAASSPLCFLRAASGLRTPSLSERGRRSPEQPEEGLLRAIEAQLRPGPPPAPG